MEPRLRMIKREPPEPGAPKQAPSPAQEATRAHIVGLEAQLRRMKALGRLDAKGAFQVQCLEEELKKAHSKLKRLLNEASRQRRRRERLRCRSSCEEEGVLALLKSCSRFQDFARELHALGFNLTRNNSAPEDANGSEDTMPEVDGVKVQVELIEGDEELATDYLIDGNSSTSEDPALSRGSSPVGWPSSNESYRRWYERQSELQRQWEESFAREQMELARGLLDSVTATFLRGVQQVLAVLTAAGRHRYPPFYPETPPP